MKRIKATKETLAISLILVLSAILNFGNLGIEGYANQYYAAGVKSMTMSFKNFFFVSFDPASFVSIDKPPIGFWIQAISAKIFGFSSWSILAPQALAGVISVALIYIIVKRSFGSAAGLISALCLAVTPVFVAVSRNNTIDNLLVMTLLFACLALTKAVEKGKTKYLFISLALVGVGFNIKMLQAYMIVPALYITYLLSNTVSLKKRLIQLTCGTVILLAVSLSWAIAVDLVPAADRPFVGSSTNNTVMELIVGHNGLERLGLGSSGNGINGSSSTSQQGQPNQGMPGNPPDGQGMPGGPFDGNGKRDDGMGAPGGGGNGGTFGGQEKAGFTRLFSQNSLSDQIIWLFPLAIFGFVAAAIKEKFRSPFNKKHLSLLLWIVWLLPEFIYFSFTKGLFHPYYLTMLAPPIAALAGIGIVSMWELYKEGGLKSWILPAALIADGLTQALILSYYYTTSSITKYIMAALVMLCFVSSIWLIIANIFNKRGQEVKESNIKLKKTLISIALAGLLIAPTIWSGTAIFYQASGTFPSAGLELASSRGMGNFNPGMGNSNNDSTEKLVKYLKSNITTEKYLVAVPSAMNYASDIIIKTGEPVIALGGFSGSDKILTLDQFKKLISSGELRYAIVDGNGGQGGSNEITNWVKQNGKAISESVWNDSASSNNDSSSNNNDGNMRGFGGRNSIQVYDLKGITASEKQ